MEEQNYEFTEEQNLSLKKLTSQMNFVGVFTLVLGVFLVALGIYYTMATSKTIILAIFVFVMALVIIVMGVYTMGSAKSFKLVIKTEGDDINNLMRALDKMTTWFGIVSLMIVVTIAILILGFIAKLLSS
jgi:hypothetical protein